MGRKKKTLEQQEAPQGFVMQSEEPIDHKKYLSEAELHKIKVLDQEVSISKLKSENLALKIKNTELIILELQHNIAELKTELRKSLESEKASKENTRQNMVSIKSKYSIEGNFAFDPISGEIITE